MLCKESRANFNLILCVPHVQKIRMGIALKTPLDLLFLQQAMSPDGNSDGHLHLMKK